jgi:hypothetical protein
MAANDYVLHSEWSIPGKAAEIYRILIEFAAYERWWADVYLDVEQSATGDEDGLGAEASFRTKGKVNYPLKWSAQVGSTNFPHGFSFDATGDLVGRGAWALEQHGDRVHVAFDWTVRAEKPLLKHFSFLLKPVVRANHRWAMQRGQELLIKELDRRHKPKKSERR